ncbi:MAG: AbrB/MazE/SpoVT family DNA-binding domain-containing protein [Acidobacteria bacterium]|nr:AbrB/MazE/SpoVT family DNA-binding domain-containing protein [Acidobacteriota bacterium]
MRKRCVTKIGPGGRVVIPAEYRTALGVRPDDEVVLTLDDGQVRLYTKEWARKRAQDYVCSLVPPGVSLADELIRERREEAARE